MRVSSKERTTTEGSRWVLLWIGIRAFGCRACSIGDSLLVIVGLKWRDAMGRTWWYV